MNEDNYKPLRIVELYQSNTETYIEINNIRRHKYEN